jgi:hypothetical protein
LRERHLPEAGLRRPDLDGREAVVLDADQQRWIWKGADLWNPLSLGPGPCLGRAQLGARRVERETLHRLMKRYGIRSEDFRRR